MPTFVRQLLQLHPVFTLSLGFDTRHQHPLNQTPQLLSVLLAVSGPAVSSSVSVSLIFNQPSASHRSNSATLPRVLLAVSEPAIWILAASDPIVPNPAVLRASLVGALLQSLRSRRLAHPPPVPTLFEGLVPITPPPNAKTSA
ncbi:hypothetical protein A1Q2_02369 [Trichosporon asahii var. asahii CBS 8904]|uniref:Uncharacterized protein n=1 Tax=Trichosporon asahii var. asahii (strain CBS 8904) TaxID=1220162 RepID=K1VGU5_TRIAC|nr:hypothetical protein A1Q2_02369 [Trichosporon asahii var. asahii CBS 8904]